MAEKSLIWTTHAQERLRERKMNKENVEQSVRYPDNTKKGKEPDTTEFIRRFNKQTITVVAKQKNSGEWLILSAWIDPPYYGTLDAKKKQNYQKYYHASSLGKIWMIIKEQLGLS